MCRCAASSSLWLLTLLASTTGALDKPDISWGDWIIIEDTAPADSGASLLLRRITPKSVFVAPNFNNCPEGYRQDALGRCVKLVQVNKQAQWNFFLEKLNSMYAPSPSQVGKESGPFHVNLPIGGGGGAAMEQSSATARQTTPAATTTTLFDTDIPSTMEDLITTIKVDRDTTKVAQDEERETTTVEDTTKSPTEETSPAFDQTTTTTDTTEAETTVNGDTDENRTESDRPETQTVSRGDDDARPFIIVVTDRPDGATVALTTVDDPTASESAATERNSQTARVEPIAVKLPHSVKSKCDLSVQVSRSKDELASNIDCEPYASESATRRSSEPDVKIRFPSDSIRQTSSFVRFPEDGKPREDTRRPFRWSSSWEYQQHPDIMAWPPAGKPPASYRHYGPRSSIRHTQTWSNSPPWHRRIIQRD